MNRRIVALPVDARPVVRSQVVDLVACAGWELVVPEVAALGHLRTPADREALQAWLLAEAPNAAGVVLSLDMLLYGGLVPSRFVDDAQASLQPRLALLRTLKQRHPGLPLYAFAATMRISNNNVAEEEKPYWAQYGSLLWRWSYHTDRARQTGDAASHDAAAAAMAAITPSVREDYVATRERNFALVMQAIDLVHEGVIDRLALPQDDTAAFGFNIAERRALQARVAALGLRQRVHICPGADEVLPTLTAHLVARLEGRRPLRVQVAHSDPARVGALQALYEDRPLLQSIDDQLAAVGAVAVVQQPDLLLAVHTQGGAQGDWAMARPLPSRPGVVQGWFERLHIAAAAGTPIALADLAFANGGDPWLLAQDLPPLFSYAGWNTASNRLGGLLAHAVLAAGRWFEPASQQVLALRLFEDGLYQPVLRAALRGCAGGADGEAQLPRGALLAQAQALVPPWCNAWAAARGLPYRVRDVALPWDRSFEIDMKLERVS